MGKIIMSENVTLDGAMQDPSGEEGFARGGWFFPTSDKDRETWAELELEQALGAKALLLGRRSDRWFAARWRSRSGKWADQLKGLPKFVVSSTLREPPWTNTTVLTGDAMNEISELRQKLDGDIVVYASTQLVHTLIEHGLVDELRRIVYPVILGSGERLFGETSNMKSMRLVDARPLGDNLVYPL